jgi:septal ring-binding cell division protein DamX
LALDAPNQATLNAINAILSLPNKDSLKLSDKALVESARNAYNQVASTTQQGILIDGGYYDILVGAEKKFENLEYLQNQGGSGDSETDTDTDITPPEQNEPTDEPQKNTGRTVAIVILVVLAALAVAGYMVPVFMKLIPSIKAKKQAKQDVAPVNKALEPENTEADDASNNN